VTAGLLLVAACGDANTRFMEVHWEVKEEVGQGHVHKSICGVGQRKLASRSNLISRS